ncbi:SDR family NAD(P)-dependent oxidoreductase [Streptomyces sp. NPDC057611]|uniref:SDR family NAD(P)-dependent oxidoreductase n=1 Tax=Streptomyces sp. NPDC057611 TaxID=3346182 RepID=UPI003697F4CA
MSARVAVVTGAASGIGAAVCRSLEETGWTVCGLDLRPVEHLKYSYECDVADPASVSAAFGRIEAEVGPVGALVTAAGHYELVPVGEITEEAWNRMMHVHVGGLLNPVRAVLPGMIDRGEGAVVAISSELGIGGTESEAHYSAAKGAILGFVRSLGAEVAEHGVRVNAVAPGPTDTPLLPTAQRTPEYLASLPARALGQPEDIAQAVQFLVDEGGFCFGEVLSPNMGAVI